MPRVPTYRRALCQLVGSYHLDVEVLGLRLPSGLNEPLKNLGGERERGVGIIIMSLDPIFSL